MSARGGAFKEIIDQSTADIISHLNKLNSNLDSLANKYVTQKEQLSQCITDITQQLNSIQTLRETILDLEKELNLLDERVKKLEESHLFDTLQSKARINLFNGLVKYGPVLSTILITAFTAIIALHSGHHYAANRSPM